MAAFFTACGKKRLLVAPHFYSSFRFNVNILCHKRVDWVYHFPQMPDLKFLWICIESFYLKPISYSVAGLHDFFHNN